MNTSSRILLTFLILISGPLHADTFKHRTTGETFTGYRTHKKSVGKVLVFNAAENKSVPMDLSDYEITRDDQGRRNSVMVIKLDQPEVLISEAVAGQAAEMILKAADQGPKGIIVQIDLPGGQGGPMRQIAEAITKAVDDTGCRVAAFLPGGSYGGAFSAAGIVALACETIYISPTAAMGAVGPLGAGGAKTDEEYLQMLQTYASDFLSSFSVYAATLAQRNNRPELLAQALLDKHLTIAEVKSPDGKLSIVEISRRQENQSVVRILAEGMPQASSESSPLRAVGKLLSLPSAEAVRWKLADKQAASLSEVLADMGLKEVPIVNVGGLTTIIQKFTTAKKNLDQLLAKIQAEEERVSTLEDHLNSLEEIAIKSTMTREVTKGGQYQNYRRGTVRLTDSDRLWDRYSNERDTGDQTDIPLQDRYGREITTRERSGPGSRERIIEEQPVGNIVDIRRQLIAITAEMIADYQRAIGLARRWPGALPAGISLETLQKNLLSAQTLLTSQQRRLMQGY